MTTESSIPTLTNSQGRFTGIF